MGKLVPWSSWEEWKAVCDGLSSSDVAAQLAAVERVEVWRARGRVPLAVEVSAALVETMIMDSTSAATGKTRPLGLSECGLRSQYALAIIRLVNGITDSQQKGRVAVSVASLASAAGLPRALVDLRHEATHNELPALPVLRLAAHQALAWLHASYWDAQRAHLQASLDRVAALLAALQQSCTAACSKALRSQQQLAGSSEDEDAWQEGTYQAADGQKQRKQLLSDLRKLAPPAWAVLVADAIVGRADARAPPAAATAAAARGTPVQAAAAAQADAARCAAKGWQSCLATLAKVYPNLLQLLLEGAVRRLATGSDQAQPAAGPVPQVAAAVQSTEQQRWQQWASYLLDGPGGSSSSGTALGALQQGKKRMRSNSSSQLDLAAAGGGAAGSSLHFSPSAVQLQHLLRLALAGHSTAWQQGAAEQAQVLLALCQKLAVRLSSRQQEQQASAAKLIKLVDMLVAAATLISTGASAEEAGSQSADLATAELAQQELLAKLAAARSAAAAAAAAAAADEVKEAEELAPASKRWRRCSTWQLCAIGCLPDAFDGNGMLSHLSAPRHSDAADATMVQAEEELAPAATGVQQVVLVVPCGAGAGAGTGAGAGAAAVHEEDLDWRLPDDQLHEEEADAACEAQQGGIQLGSWWLPASEVQTLQQSVAVL